ncbi:MAG: four helix bundle protein [Verrucomicrobia bacterium]|nr:MAG: four helix bundle protein [Verrucomicrobiota bacterium]
MLKEDAGEPGPNRHPFDLEERTAKFGEAIVKFSKKIPRDPTNNRLIDQLVGAGTSVGSNYHEANASVSGKDFRFSVSRSLKEAKETKFFLRMVAASESELAPEARELYREANELQLIFAEMYNKKKR